MEVFETILLASNKAFVQFEDQMGEISFFLHVSCVMAVGGNGLARSLRMLPNIYQMPSVLLDMKKYTLSLSYIFITSVYSNKIED